MSEMSEMGVVDQDVEAMDSSTWRPLALDAGLAHNSGELLEVKDER
jgi:hypothetical protein